jgi:L-ascorbate metabolism protein UlaG (beta-lactamase superfamily)
MSRFSRRRVLLGVGAMVAGTAGWIGLGPRPRNSYYQGPASDHFDGTSFFNPGGDTTNSISALLRFRFGETFAPWPERVPANTDAPPRRVAGTSIRVSYIGHASFLIQGGGVNLLVDPVWSDRVSPVSFAGPKRVSPPAVSLDALPPIDGILITHNHYDHLDVDTVGRIWRRDRPQIVTPLGNDTILKASIEGIVARGSDWGDTIEVHARSDGGTCRVHLVPTHHWSARGLRDRRHALWASFVVEIGRSQIYAIGDTGFGQGRNFKHVRDRFGAIDLALIPIGAYEPRWFMRKQHINPAEAVEAFEIVGARRALGHHWGTFQLTTEPHDAPPSDLATALASRGIDPSRFRAVRSGHVETIAPPA